MATFFAFAFVCTMSAAALGASHSGPTWDFFQQTQTRPVTTYECYRTGATHEEPEDTVNFTIFWDGTQPLNKGGEAMIRFAKKATPDRYAASSFAFSWEANTSSIYVNSGDAEKRVYVLRGPYNHLAYQIKLVLSSEGNKEVWKTYDEDYTCANGALLLRDVVDPDGTRGYLLSREIPEPTETCSKTSLCAP